MILRVPTHIRSLREKRRFFLQKTHNFEASLSPLEKSKWRESFSVLKLSEVGKHQIKKALTKPDLI